MFGFIHITKTGGTDLKHKYKDYFIYDNYHYSDAKFFKENNIPSFAIIREPIDRFKSLFRYNLKGGSDYWEKDYYAEDINTFIKEMKKNPTIVQAFEQGWQFRKQIEWLNDETYIIKYDENIYKNIHFFLKNEFHIELPPCQHEKKNVSLKINDTISPENMIYLKEYYKEDIIVYNQLQDRIYTKWNPYTSYLDDFESNLHLSSWTWIWMIPLISIPLISIPYFIDKIKK